VRFEKILLALIIISLNASPVCAQSFCPLDESRPDPIMVGSVDAFAKLAILHEGRVKPVDTYARNLLLQFSGRTTLDRKPAVEWFSRLVFAPATTKNDKVFLINNPQIPMALGIEEEEKRRYSFNQLNRGFEKIVELARVAQQIDEKNRSIVEHEVLRIYHNVVLYTQFSFVSTFAFPHPDFQMTDPSIIAQLGLPRDQKGQFSFFDIVLTADALRAATHGLEEGSPQMWSQKEKKIFHLLANLFQWAQSYNDLPFHVIPSADLRDEVWFSPWDAINKEFHDERVKSEVSLLRDQIVHYWNGDQLAFDFALRAFEHSVKGRIDGREKKSVKQIPLELFYNKANFFMWAKIFYGLAFFVFVFSLFLPGWKLRKVAFGLVIAGLAVHMAAIIVRMVIMARPPVSNLYETFIFVGFVAVLLGIVIELIHKQWLGILVSSVCGVVLLFISAKFSAEGDTMKMLVAVLNSNFWLSTHVLSITTGYAGCCVAGIIGHLYIIQRLFKPKAKKLLEATYRNLVGALLFGLMMTFLGTMLGGIWADQSWGRFWGWDPKENGALLIVIWCAIIFHARIAKLIGPLGMAVGSVLGIIVVMWAWFGVNLLSIGLHSYGFTTGAASSLAIYIFSELLFLTLSLWIIRNGINLKFIKNKEGSKL